MEKCQTKNKSVYYWETEHRIKSFDFQAACTWRRRSSLHLFTVHHWLIHFQFAGSLFLSRSRSPSLSLLYFIHTKTYGLSLWFTTQTIQSYCGIHWRRNSFDLNFFLLFCFFLDYFFFRFYVWFIKIIFFLFSYCIPLLWNFLHWNKTEKKKKKK